MLTFDRQSSRYRDERGRFVAEKVVKKAVEKVVDVAGRQMRDAAKEFNKGKINLPEFQNQMKEAIKSVHILTSSVANGGRKNMSASDWGKVGNELKGQYKFLNNFARQIEKGQVSSAQIEVRAASYGKAARSAFFALEQANKAESGFTEAKRVLHALESCGECASWAGKGFVSIESQPHIGSLVCRSFCRCEIVYR